jgi:sugar phosphate isomerase/epimerase
VELGVTLAIRNEYWSLFGGERILPLLSALPDTVKLDLDTAHLFVAGISATDFLRDHASRIGCVHLTDTSLVDTGEIWKTPIPSSPAGRRPRSSAIRARGPSICGRLSPRWIR